MSSFTQVVSNDPVAGGSHTLVFFADKVAAVSLYTLGSTKASHNHDVPLTTFISSKYDSLTDLDAAQPSYAKYNVLAAAHDYTISKSLALSGSNQSISSYTVECMTVMDRFTPSTKQTSDLSQPKVSVTWTRYGTYATESRGTYTYSSTPTDLYIGISGPNKQ